MMGYVEIVDNFLSFDVIEKKSAGALVPQLNNLHKIALRQM